MSNDTWELCYLCRDPDEQTNLYAQPFTMGVQLALMAEWKRWTRDNGMFAENLTQGGQIEKVSWNEQQLQKLRALGYAQ